MADFQRFLVRPNRTVTFPSGTVWATGGQIIEADMAHDWMQKALMGQMNKLVPAPEAEGEPVALPENLLNTLQGRGYGKADTSVKAEQAVKKRGPGRPRKEEAAPAKLADPEE